MAHFQQLQFVHLAARHIAEDWRGLSVLEIGSADVNGSIRPFFAGSRYVGVDLEPGPGVDLVGSGEDVRLDDDSFDVTVSCECFEHNPAWCDTFLNMHRMTRPGGIVIVTCASRGRPEHGTTRTRPFDSPGTIARGWNYYRNLNRADFEARIPIEKLFETHAFFRNEVSKDLYFVGRKHRGEARPLRLEVSELWNEASLVNTCVTPDARQGIRQRLRAAIDRPLKWAEVLPDPQYQNFVIRWKAAERTVRGVLRRK